MKKLKTIQKRNILNNVYAVGEVGPGGAYHEYKINAASSTEDESNITTIKFQKGPRKEKESIQGVIDTDLLEIVRDRLKSFQSGDFSSRENACAITHIEEALMWMNKRVEDRAEQNILGTYEKTK